jgi:uncharacterized protein involved in exopolysaccharide biosynthesis
MIPTNWLRPFRIGRGDYIVRSAELPERPAGPGLPFFIGLGATLGALMSIAFLLLVQFIHRIRELGSSPGHT